MIEKEIFFTFTYENWSLATTIEIIIDKITDGKEILWIDWAGQFNPEYKYRIADRLQNFIVKKRIVKSNLVKSIERFGKIGQFKRQNSYEFQNLKYFDIDDLLDEVTYLELISSVRESKPSKHIYRKVLRKYEKTFICTFNAAIKTLTEEKPNKVFIKNGRFLQERAVWEACRFMDVPVVFYEKFNPNWFDRYFLFNKRTHSPSYRSSVMNIFAESVKKHSVDNFISISNKWFDDRIYGRSQKFIEHKSGELKLGISKPYLVFFHSSEDELISTDLISKNWGDQISALSELIRVVHENQIYTLVIRMHPNLMNKSKNEINFWNSYGMELQRKYPWIVFIRATNPINSYNLIENSEGVVTVGSTIGVEAAFMGKKSILIGRAFHEDMSITFNPMNTDDLKNTLDLKITGDLMRNFKDNARKYGIFHEIGGLKFKNVQMCKKKDRIRYSFEDFEIYLPIIVSLLIRFDSCVNNFLSYFNYYRQRRKRNYGY